MQAPSLPAPEEIALLEPFERIGLDRIAVVATEAEAELAADALVLAPVWGFDTESRPTFEAGVASEGPHIVQLATREAVFIFQLHDAGCRAIAGELLERSGIIKAGFGLRDDRRRIVNKLGVEPQEVLDLDTVFRERGYRRQMGVKAAVAVLFGKRYLKSKRAATSNWAHRRLTESQLLYAANDAWAALRVYEALGLAG
ncbi:3'-5' exonuclease domain-containing protein 2 [Ramlibacter sp. USB13]|uniref:3'-5' exonuclease domain-containing protein 2 n=1 Tax=Ramlibacter cellulosilyticus TaxID=2764187 RepID=A0A923MSZ8_9BURK|nr:3'-5' exonuclease [Ramlibacter cellulosilyticus]MBC5783262.1 3'-5' exonuclease domain-containing protein 2 [Ramlibacter cellulosilyticus]